MHRAGRVDVDESEANIRDRVERSRHRDDARDRDPGEWSDPRRKRHEPSDVPGQGSDRDHQEGKDTEGRPGDSL